MLERRLANDGLAYTFAEFNKFYIGHGQFYWDQAGASRHNSWPLGQSSEPASSLAQVAASGSASASAVGVCSSVAAEPLGDLRLPVSAAVVPLTTPAATPKAYPPPPPAPRKTSSNATPTATHAALVPVSAAGATQPGLAAAVLDSSVRGFWDGF